MNLISLKAFWPQKANELLGMGGEMNTKIKHGGQSKKKENKSRKLFGLEICYHIVSSTWTRHDGTETA